MNNQELIRRKQYCQIVKEITRSDQYLVVGIDVGKDKHRYRQPSIDPIR